MLMTLTVPPPASRVTSSAWVKKLKDELGEADSADPTIFVENEAAAVPPANERSSSGESAISFLAEAALNDAIASRNSSFASMMGVSLGTISLEADPIFSAALGNSGEASALSNQRKSTIEYLKKMGLLGSTTLCTDALVRKSLLGETDENNSATTPSRKRPVTVGKNAGSQNGESANVEIKDIREWDILSGRGGKSNHYPGNKRFRQVVAEMKAKYKTTDAKTDKTALSKAIVEYVNGYGGRFLKLEKGKTDYRHMTKTEARKKTSQALRETKELKWKL